MSYSFSVTGSTKADVKQKIAEAFASVITAQPMHAADRDASIACAGASVDTLVDPTESQEILVNMNGSLGWRDGAAKEFTSANVGVAAQVRNKTP